MERYVVFLFEADAEIHQLYVIRGNDIDTDDQCEIVLEGDN